MRSAAVKQGKRALQRLFMRAVMRRPLAAFIGSVGYGLFKGGINRLRTCILCAVNERTAARKGAEEHEKTI